MEAKYIFVTGGVVSSLGKGIISASIGRLLQARGYRITIQKFDPYINVDPGTLNPNEHGECYVTADGCETDLDLGHYERFTDIQTFYPVGINGSLRQPSDILYLSGFFLEYLNEPLTDDFPFLFRF